MNLIIKKKGVQNVLLDSEMEVLVKIVNAAKSKDESEQKIINRIKIFLTDEPSNKENKND